MVKKLTFPSYCPWKRAAKKEVREKRAGELWAWESQECEVAERRGSRLCSHKISLPFTLTSTRYTQTTPYLMTLICILSRGVSLNVNIDRIVLLCNVRDQPTFQDKIDSPWLSRRLLKLCSRGYIIQHYCMHCHTFYADSFHKKQAIKQAVSISSYKAYPNLGLIYIHNNINISHTTKNLSLQLIFLLFQDLFIWLFTKIPVCKMPWQK